MSWRTGESHPKAKLTDRDVDLMRALHEDHFISIPECARKFEISYFTAYDILKYKTRT